jgi:sorting nexin-4
MAVIDQENFSNISWHSDRNVGPASHPGGADDGGEGSGSNGERRAEMGPDDQLDDPAGLGSETLDCIVGSPIKENDGTKDAFVSYQITTRVR